MSRPFLTGLIVGLLIFGAINLLAAHLASDCSLPAIIGQDACADDIARAGWPLQFYEEGGFAYRNEFSFLSLLVNFGIGLGVSSITGWLFARYKSGPPK